MEFIEGIGPNMGVLHSVDPTSFYNQLICAHKDGNMVFADSSLFTLGPCMIHSVGIEESLQEVKVSVSPNPATDNILHLEEPLTAEIFITDALGRNVFNKNISGPKTEVNTIQWPAGIYFYHIRQDGKQAATGKIMVVR